MSKIQFISRLNPLVEADSFSVLNMSSRESFVSRISSYEKKLFSFCARCNARSTNWIIQIIRKTPVWLIVEREYDNFAKSRKKYKNKF